MKKILRFCMTMASILNSTKDKVVDTECFHFHYIDHKTFGTKHHTVVSGDIYIYANIC